jgi:predicted metalloprotease
MRWECERRSDNIENQRGMRAGRRGLAGGIGATIVARVVMYYCAAPSMALNQAATLTTTQKVPEEARLKEFMPAVLADTGVRLAAAAGVGDERLQRPRGAVVPKSFIRPSEQRMHWFSRDIPSGDPAQGDAFRATRL